MREGSPSEVLLIFLKLGVTAFGGPVAHIGYFREEIVVKRHWVDDATFSDLVALCQFLPGPTSSQVGFALGMGRAGYWGGIAAWTGFTLPSALLMTLFGLGAGSLDNPLGAGVLHGLKLVAVAIVAQAVWGMARTLCPDRPRVAIAALVAAAVLWRGSSLMQIAALLFGAATGFWVYRGRTVAPSGAVAVRVSRPVALAALGAFFGLFAALPVLHAATSIPGLPLFEVFYRSGALVFGGGHVVLPLLRDAVVPAGWVSDGTFLAGYGAAQAIPGPLFTFAAYLGAVEAPSPHGLVGAATALVAIFLPGVLVLIGSIAFWETVRTRSDAQSLMHGINAAVVGLLGAAWVSPLWTRSIATVQDAAVAVIGFILLRVFRAPPVVVVATGALVGVALSK